MMNAAKCVVCTFMGRDCSVGCLFEDFVPEEDSKSLVAICAIYEFDWVEGMLRNFEENGLQDLRSPFRDLLSLKSFEKTKNLDTKTFERLVSVMKKNYQLTAANDILKKENGTLKDELLKYQFQKQNSNTGERSSDQQMVLTSCAKCAACMFLKRDCIANCPYLNFLNFIPGGDLNKFLEIYVLHGSEWLDKFPRDCSDDVFPYLYFTMSFNAEEQILNLGNENVDLIVSLRKKVSTLTAENNDMEKEKNKLLLEISILRSHLGEGCSQQLVVLEEAAKCVVCNLIGRGCCEEGCVFRNSGFAGEDKQKFIEVYAVHGIEWLEDMLRRFEIQGLQEFYSTFYRSVLLKAREKVSKLEDENFNLVVKMRKGVDTLTFVNKSMKKDNVRLLDEVEILRKKFAEKFKPQPMDSQPPKTNAQKQHMLSADTNSQRPMHVGVGAGTFMELLHSVETNAQQKMLPEHHQPMSSGELSVPKCPVIIIEDTTSGDSGSGSGQNQGDMVSAGSESPVDATSQGGSHNSPMDASSGGSSGGSRGPVFADEAELSLGFDPIGSSIGSFLFFDNVPVPQSDVPLGSDSKGHS